MDQKKMHPPVVLRTLTLNCWGIPYITKDKSVRFKYIAEELSKGDYDVISLQEVVDLKDYAMLCKRLSQSYPHQHYFYSGLGSGVCVFSKSVIIDTAIYHYSINSFPHNIHQLDWYARKMLGLVQIDHHGLKVNIFATHVCAIFSASHLIESDLLSTHRLVQCYEISNIIRQVGQSADVNVLLGDLNSEPFSLAKKVLMANANLKDVWEERPNTEDDSGETCECELNCYTHMNHRVYEKFQNGMRIDYIMYNSHPDYHVQCEDARLALRNIPGTMLVPSDHEAVSATLKIMRSTGGEKPQLSEELPSLLDDVVKVLESAYARVYQKKLQCGGIVACLILVIAVIQLTPIGNVIYGKFLISAISVVGLWICLWHIFVERVFEASSLRSHLDSVKIRKNYARNILDLKRN